MIDISHLDITIENPKGSYKSFDIVGDPVRSRYPLEGVTYPVDYGCINGYTGEDEAELDIFVGSGALQGYIKVWRLDVPEETKFFIQLTDKELEAIQQEFKPVLVETKMLNGKEFTKKLEQFRDKQI